jgi:hypothetical protein
MLFIRSVKNKYKIVASTSRYIHGSPTDHGDILEVLPYGSSEYGHDFGGVFLAEDSKWGHIGTSKNFWYYIDLKDSEILALNDLYHRHYKNPKVKKVVEFFTPDDDDEVSKDDFIWDAICERINRHGNDDYFNRLKRIFGEDAEWQLQTIQGQIAKELGFKAVEMKDERGTAYLLVGSNKMQRLIEDEEE